MQKHHFIFVVYLGFAIFSQMMNAKANPDAQSVPYTGEKSRSSLPPPGPPQQNPHPPVTDQDKARVAFADLAITRLLMSPAQNKISNLPSGQDQTMGLKINLACLKSPDCLKQQVTAVKYTDAIKGEYGVVAESRFTHIIPWSFSKFQKQGIASAPHADGAVDAQQDMSIAAMPSPKLAPNEYMLHSYVRFKHVPNAAPDWLGPWFHLDIIVTEEAGEIQLQRFFLYQMPDYKSDLPPGVVC